MFKRWFLKLREWFYKKLHQALAARAIRALVGYCANTYASFKGFLVTLGSNVKAALYAATNWLADTHLVSWLMASKISVIAAAGTALAALPFVVTGITALAFGTMIVSTVSTVAYDVTVIPAVHSTVQLPLAA